MEDIVKIQESFEDLTKEVEKFKSMSELAQSNQLSISEMSKQLTKVIVNFEKYRNLLDGRIDRQSNSIESLLGELRNTQQGIGSSLRKFDDTLGRNLKSIIDSSALQVTDNTNKIIRAFTNGNDQTVSELVSILSSVDEIRKNIEHLQSQQTKHAELLVENMYALQKRTGRLYAISWILLSVFVLLISCVAYYIIIKN